jgi:hypothetical protein
MQKTEYTPQDKKLATDQCKCHRCHDKNFLIECACGFCEEFTTKCDSRGRPRNFIASHTSRGSNNANYKNGRTKSLGYCIISTRKDHHTGERHYGRVREHIAIFEETHNCCLLDWGVVHHRDGVKSNNIWYNLQGMTLPQHTRLHQLKDMTNRKCSRCGSENTHGQKRATGIKTCWHVDKINLGYFVCTKCYAKQHHR